MPDIYVPLRTLPFSVLAPALGIDLSRFKNRKDEWQGYCPVHGSEGNNCFSYNTANGKWHCFSCDAKGSGAIDLVVKVKGLGFKDACAFLQPLAAQTPVAMKKDAPGANSEATEPLKPFKGSYEKYAVPCEWLEKRIPDEGIRKGYGVFCYENKARKSAYSGRVMLPVRDSQGILYGYLGRNVDEQDNSPKYLFPPNLPKSRFLFGADQVKAGAFGPCPVRVLYLVESPFCCLKYAMYGLPAVSPFGWAVSNEQLEILHSIAKGAIYLPDRNKTHESGNVLQSLARRIWARCPPLPDGIDDPENLTKEQVLALTR